MRNGNSILNNELLLRDIISKSGTYTECLEKMGIRCAGGNYETLRKYIEKFEIDTSHFVDTRKIRRRRKSEIPIDSVLVENSKYNRSSLKKRLYESSLKTPICEMCGQDENWHGKKISLILDHINGVHNDNRIENLRIVCPNCNATLETHGGRNFNTKSKSIHIKSKGLSDKRKTFLENRRKANRPPFDVLQKEVIENGYSATGRKYGVSDNAIRKWIEYYSKYNTVE